LTVPKIDPVLAATILAETADISYFPGIKKLVEWGRFVPGIYQSEHRKHITGKIEENLSKQDEKYLEKLLNQFDGLEKYRTLSLRISEVYHIPAEKPGVETILRAELWDCTGNEVEIAVKKLEKKCEENTQF